LPFVSEAERRWGHTKEGEKALGGPAAVHEWDEATKGKDLPERKNMKDKRGHPYSHTTTHHHKDGSNTSKHHHESDPAKDLEYAVPDHEGMMAGMESNLGGGAGEAEAAPGAAGGAPMPGAGA